MIQRIEVQRLIEKQTGFSFRILDEKEFDNRTRELYAEDDAYRAIHGEPDYSTYGTDKWPLHYYSFPSVSEWITDKHTTVRFTDSGATCYVGVAIDEARNLRLFHDDSQFESQWEEVERKITDGTRTIIGGFYGSGLSSLTEDAGIIFYDLGLLPLHKNDHDPQWATIGVIIDPVQREIAVAFTEALDLKLEAEEE